MRKLLAVIPVAILLGGCLGDGEIICPSTKYHPPEFWRELAQEVRDVAATKPRIMTVLSDHEVTQNAILACIAKRDGVKQKKKR